MKSQGKGRAVLMTGLMVMVVFTVMAMVPTAPVAGAPIPSYINGDWVINSNQTYWGGKLDITGSIIINEGYTLTLHRSTIVFNTDWNWIGFNVDGTLNMYDTTVTNNMMDIYYWWFNPLSSGHIENCNISNIESIEIYTSNVILESNDIHGGWQGIYVWNGNSIRPKIYNNTIRDMEESGIWLSGTGAKIIGNTIKDNNQWGWQGGAVYLDQCTGSMVFERNNVSNNAIGGLHVSNTMDFEIWDSDLRNNAGKDIMVEAPNTQTKVKLFNSTYGNVVLNSIEQRQKATFSRYWNVDVFVKKASTDRSVAGASVDINKPNGQPLIEDELTATNGFVRDLWVPEFEMVHQGFGGTAQTNDFKPHKVEVKATVNDQQLRATKEAEIDKDMQINVTLDDMPPLLVLTSPKDGLLTNETYVTVTGNTEPDVTLMVDGDLTPVGALGAFFKDIKLDEGNNVIVVSATDPAGNTVGASVTVTKDTSPPYVSILTPKNGTILSITDPYFTGSSEYGASLKINGKVVSIMPDGSFNTTIHLAEGENTIKAVAWDMVGNMASDEIIVFLDSKAPTLVIVEPKDGEKTNDPELVIKGVSDKGSTVTINGQLVNLQGSAFQYPWALLEGENVIRVRSMDDVGNSIEKIITVYLDTEPPELTITHPTDYMETSLDKVVVTGLTEPSATVKVDGVTIENFGGEFEGEAALKATQNKIVVEVIDEMGNAASKELHIIRDTIPPEILIQSPKDGEAFNSKTAGRIDVRGKTERGSTVYINGEPAEVSGEGFTLRVKLGTGNNTIEVSGYDEAGNVETRIIKVIYDPEVEYQILSPSDGSTVSTEKITTTGFIEPGAIIKINGKQAEVGPDGGFSHDIHLQTGKNTITYIIDDPAGNSETVSIYVTRKGSSLQPSSSSQGLNIGFGLLLVILIVLIVLTIARSRKGPKEPEPSSFGPTQEGPPPPDYEAAGFTSPMQEGYEGPDQAPEEDGTERLPPPPRLVTPPSVNGDVGPEPFPGDGPEKGGPEGGNTGEAEDSPGDTQTEVEEEKDLLDEIEEKEAEKSLGDRSTETEQAPGEGEGPKVVVDKEARTRKRHAARMRRQKKESG